MAVPTNTRLSYNTDTGGPDRAPGIREDLSNIIYNIAPEDTPFMSAIGKSSCDNTYFEWQIDTLSDPVANRQLEGDDASVLEAVEPARVGTFSIFISTDFLPFLCPDDKRVTKGMVYNTSSIATKIYR